jgi:ribosomal protein S18 acetylase RimI-like enzyme
MLEIRTAHCAGDYDTARELFQEYARQLGVDLCFQGFARELETLDTMYGPPGGALLLARLEGRAVGCVALRAADGGDGEMKRLYVRPQARGAGLGRLLAQAILAEARARGYRRMVLDTLEELAQARALYASLGFLEIAPYYANPLAGVRYFALELATASGAAGG